MSLIIQISEGVKYVTCLQILAMFCFLVAKEVFEQFVYLLAKTMSKSAGGGERQDNKVAHQF